MKSLQETYAPQGICFGCGVNNPQGLRIKSFVSDDEVVAQWRAESHHQAFPGILNGGIIGALLDCHCNWTAAYCLMKQQAKAVPDCTVTAQYSIKLLRPTPLASLIHLKARLFESTHDRAIVHAELSADGKVCATCQGTFVAVTPGHPAYHAW